MKKNKLLAALLFALLFSSGCYRTVFTGENLASLATLNAPAPAEQVVSHFRKKVWNHYFLLGLFPTSQIDIQQAIREDIPAGHAIRNLGIRHQWSFANMLVGFLTLNIYSPMTTVITGDVVKVAAAGETSGHARAPAAENGKQRQVNPLPETN